MSELLNMYIIKNRYFIRATILCLMLITSSVVVSAQDSIVNPLSKSEKKTIHTDVLLYVAGSRNSHGNMWTASNTIYVNNYIYGKYLDIGAEFDFCRDNGAIKFCSLLGYRVETFSFDKRFFANTGIDSHFISADIKAEYIFLGAGLKSDIFLFSRAKDQGDLSYLGYNSSCFNRLSLCAYLSCIIPFSRLKLEVRLGSYIVPHLNPNKISYVNLTKSYVDGLYFEFRLSYKIFTTGNVQRESPLLN